MTGQTVIIRGQSQRDYAKTLIDAAPVGYVVSVKAESRRDAQNRKMWPCLGDILKANPEGKFTSIWTRDILKAGFMSALGRELQIFPGLDEHSPFTYQRSSILTVKEFANLITFIQEYGDRHGVRWSEPNPYG